MTCQWHIAFLLIISHNICPSVTGQNLGHLVHNWWYNLRGQNEDSNTLEVARGIPDTVAYVGQLLIHQVTSDAFHGHVDRFSVVDEYNGILPNWMYFDEANRTFLGVPSMTDMGNTIITVTAFDAQNTSVETSFMIQLRPAQEHHPNIMAHPSGYRDVFCEWYEQVFRANLVLDIDIALLDARRRVHIIKLWANFVTSSPLSISLFARKPDPGPLDKSPLKFSKTGASILFAGPGDASLGSGNEGVVLSWVIGCGPSFTAGQDVARVLEHAVDSGTVGRMLGYDTSGWFVSEQTPVGGANIQRIKRQAQDFLSVGLRTATVVTALPTKITPEVGSSSTGTTHRPSTTTRVPSSTTPSRDAVNTTIAPETPVTTRHTTKEQVDVMTSGVDVNSSSTRAPNVTSVTDRVSTVGLSTLTADRETTSSTPSYRTSTTDVVITNGRHNNSRETSERGFEWTTSPDNSNVSSNASSPVNSTSSASPSTKFPTSNSIGSLNMTTQAASEASTVAGAQNISTKSSNNHLSTITPWLNTTESLSNATTQSLPNITTTEPLNNVTAGSITSSDFGHINITGVLPGNETVTPQTVTITGVNNVTSLTTETMYNVTSGPAIDHNMTTTESVSNLTTSVTYPSRESPKITTQMANVSMPIDFQNSTTTTTTAFWEQNLTDTAPSPSSPSPSSPSPASPSPSSSLPSSPISTDPPTTQTTLTTQGTGYSTLPTEAVSTVVMTTSVDKMTSEKMPTTSAAEVETTIVTTSRLAVPTTETFNSPPQIVSPLPRIYTLLGTFFEYSVPVNTFYDVEDGPTRNLTLTLLLSTNRSPVPLHYWVQFSTEHQYLYGVSVHSEQVYNDSSPLLLDRLLLMATDRKDASVTMEVELVIDVSSVVNISHQFVLELDLPFSAFQARTDLIVSVSRLISSFLNDSAPSDVTVTAIRNVNNTGTLFVWTNNTIVKDYCDNRTIVAVFNALTVGGSLTALQAHFGETLPIISLLLGYRGVCLAGGYVPPPKVNKNTDKGSSFPQWAIILLVFLILLLSLTLLAVLVWCCCCSRRADRGRYVPEDDEKLVLGRKRKPLIMEDELMELYDSPVRQPRKPMLLHIDSLPSTARDSPFAFSNPVYTGPHSSSGVSVTPPPPPEYGSQPEVVGDTGSDAELSDNEDYLPLDSEPVASTGEASYPGFVFATTRPPPPPYRIPPPYIQKPGFTEI